MAPLLHIINFNNLCFRVENETTLISAKNHVDLSSISEVRSYITEWPRFLGHAVYTNYSEQCKLTVRVYTLSSLVYKINASHKTGKFTCFDNVNSVQNCRVFSNAC